MNFGNACVSTPCAPEIEYVFRHAGAPLNCGGIIELQENKNTSPYPNRATQPTSTARPVSTASLTEPSLPTCRRSSRPNFQLTFDLKTAEALGLVESEVPFRLPRGRVEKTLNFVFIITAESSPSGPIVLLNSRLALGGASTSCDTGRWGAIKQTMEFWTAWTAKRHQSEFCRRSHMHGRALMVFGMRP